MFALFRRAAAAAAAKLIFMKYSSLVTRSFESGGFLGLEAQAVELDELNRCLV